NLVVAQGVGQAEVVDAAVTVAAVALVPGEQGRAAAVFAHGVGFAEEDGVGQAVRDARQVGRDPLVAFHGGGFHGEDIPVGQVIRGSPGAAVDRAVRTDGGALAVVRGIGGAQGHLEDGRANGRVPDAHVARRSRRGIDRGIIRTFRVIVDG